MYHATDVHLREYIVQGMVHGLTATGILQGPTHVLAAFFDLNVLIVGIHVKRDSWVSVMYAEELNSGKSSVTLQRTDRHGSMGQKSSDFQLSL